jgi:N-acetyl-anhydromuramyl-L-alanine amidase AmpD
MKFKTNSLKHLLLIGLIAFLLIIGPVAMEIMPPVHSSSTRQSNISHGIPYDSLTAQLPNQDDSLTAQLPNQDDSLTAQLPNQDDSLTAQLPNQAKIDEYTPILPTPRIVSQSITSPKYIPQQSIVNVHPSNYETRASQDINGKPINNQMIVVLHETVGSAASAINTFRANNVRETSQVSYHALIERNGAIVYLVPPEMRAFGAGNSVFNGRLGPETVRLHPVFPSSVNNFAYHVSLETPADGRGNGRSHSGYTAAQYQSLAWLIAQTNIPEDRVTTHQAVDRSGMRRDPRSFDPNRFLTLLQTYRNNNSTFMEFQ